MTASSIRSLFSQWADRVVALLAQATLAEILAAIALPLLALLISVRINRYVDSKPTHTLPAAIIDTIAPLLAPALAILFTLLATITLNDLGDPAVVLAFVLKLCVAWLAMHGVIILSGGRGASLFIALVIIPITLLHLFNVWDSVVKLAHEASFSVGNMNFNVYVLVKGGITIAILMWLAGLIMNLTESRLRRMRNLRASSRTLVLKFSQIGLYLLVFIFAMQALGVSLTTLSIFSGALGVGVGFGLQKIASNFISGIILLFEKSVEANDIVQMDDGTLGFVRHTGARYTLLQTFDKRDIFVPNEDFITKQVINLTHSDRSGRVEVAVGISYDSDVKLALKLVEQAANMVPRCLKEPAAKANLVAFAESSINILLYFWVADISEGRAVPISDCMLNILALFKEHGINIPYPHQVQVADPMFEGRIKAIEDKLAKLAKPAASEKKAKP